MFGRNGELGMVKFSIINDKIIEMFICDNKYIVAVVNKDNNIVIKGKKNLSLKKAEALYAKYYKEYDMANNDLR